VAAQQSIIILTYNMLVSISEIPSPHINLYIALQLYDLVFTITFIFIHSLVYIYYWLLHIRIFFRVFII